MECNPGFKDVFPLGVLIYAVSSHHTNKIILLFTKLDLLRQTAGSYSSVVIFPIQKLRKRC